MKYYAAKESKLTQREIDNMALSRSLAGECVVLLKNEHQTLPLAKGGNIALYGNGARATVKGGTGSGDVNSRSVVNIEQGLEEAGYAVTTKGWLERFEAEYNAAKKEYMRITTAEAKRRGVSQIVACFDNPMEPIPPVEVTKEDIDASNADTAVYVIARNSGEGADRKCCKGDYLLWDEEKAILKTIQENYKKVVLVLNIGGVMDASEFSKMDGVGAIVLMTQLGNIGGNVLADILLGDVTPSGKLVDTWAADYKDYPSSATFSHNNGNVHDDWYTEGIYVGYRYFDSFDVAPVYPFGYGLSYTDFSVETLDVCVDGANVKVKVKVENTGDKYSGKEVVQVYYSAPSLELAKPYQELVAFAKTKELAPKEAQELEICFILSDMASYNESEASWVLEAGEYVIRVGNQSRDTVPAAALVVPSYTVTETCKNLFPLDCELQEIQAEDEASFYEAELKKITVDPSVIELRKNSYQQGRPELTSNTDKVLTMQDVVDGKATVEELVAQLTIKEMATLCVGSARKMGAIVGNTSHNVPGATGDTSSIVKESRAIKNMVLTDGPAGLRLQPHFKVDANGKIMPGGEVSGEVVAEFGEGSDAEGVVDYYQYCTAIPIGWGLAQSWNTNLVKKVGAMIGGEMELFGIDIWLAPAMNIHRNPLCGRNFEYYSEDPLVSGKMAAAMTKGVQSVSGKGTCIKHFAVNNQEENRYFTNAHVSERALREIYLKGFEITIKESQPLSIMTSYNLINGIHAANNYDLIQSVARDEWGFEGVVMTDWYTSQNASMITGKYESKYPISSSAGCIFAGNDLQMPGCQINVDDIVESVESGEEKDGYRITKGDLQYNAANVVRAALKTM